MVLIRPSLAHIDEYTDALKTGWSPRPALAECAEEELLAISSDVSTFVETLDDPEARGGDIKLSDGSFVKRLPSFRRWIWNDGFCGSIELRWQKGTDALPPTCLGHIGYSVVPWRRGEGLATVALSGMLPKARSVGLTAVDLTTEHANKASIRVIQKNGGRLVTQSEKISAHGGGEELLLRIALLT